MEENSQPAVVHELPAPGTREDDERILRLLTKALATPPTPSELESGVRSRHWEDVALSTRQWIEGKSAEDLKRLDKALENVRTMEEVGKFLRWAWIIIGALVVGVGGLITLINQVRQWK